MRRITDRRASVGPRLWQRMVLGWSIALAAMSVLLLIINYYVFVSLRQQIIAREESQLQQIVDVTGVAVDHMFASTRVALESIRTHVGSETPPLQAYEMLKTTADAAPFLRALSIVGADGTYIHSSRSFPAPKINLSRSPVVSHFVNSLSTGSYYVSEPTRNAIDKQWQVLSGIPVRDLNGKVTRIIAAIVDTKLIYSEMLSRNVGEVGDVFLVDSQYRLVASNPWQDDQIGNRLDSVAIFKKLRESNNLSTSGIVEGFNSRGTVIAAVRWLKDRRFALSTSRTLSSVLADWRVLSLVVGGVSAAILLLLALTGSVSIRGAIRRQEQSDTLLEVEQRFRAMVDGVSDHAIYMVDVDGRVSNWNNGAERVKGYDAKSIIGKNFRVFYTAEDQLNHVPEHGLAVAAERGVYKAEGWHVRANGSHFWAAVVITAVRDPSGHLIGFAEVTRDISEANAIRLELKVAKERAERASVAKTDFLANMSHEIRTPLNGIIGYSDLALEDTSVSSETRQHIARVFEASKALRVIIDDVLDFSKFEKCDVELELSPFSIRELTENCAAIFKLIALEKGLLLTSHVDADVPEVLVGDCPRLRQVLINLLNNAVKFTASGSVKLTLTCAAQADDRVMLYIKVTDTGIGISHDDQKKLFQRFNQADSSISRKYGGTGLGLAITQRIVEAMKGKVEIESTVGKGSTFKFSIVLPIGAAVTSARDDIISENRLSLRVLVVDDVKMNRDLCEAILTRAGHSVAVAADGPHAVQLVTNENFDVVLMDIQMPGMDGLEATHRIRSLEHGKGALPIVALTANVMVEQVARFKAAGMDDCIAKPIDKVALLDKLSKVVGLARIANPPAASSGLAPDVPVLDKDMLDELRSFTGHEKVSNFARDLKAAVANFPAKWPETGDALADRDRLRMAAHMAVALAGQLGFTPLAEACRLLEAACLDGQPIAPALEGLRAAGVAARRDIDTIADAA